MSNLPPTLMREYLDVLNIPLNFHSFAQKKDTDAPDTAYIRLHAIKKEVMNRLKTKVALINDDSVL